MRLRASLISTRSTFSDSIRQSKNRNTHQHSDIIRTIKLIRSFSNHKAAHYTGCATCRAKSCEALLPTQNSIFFKLQKLLFFCLFLVNDCTQRCLYILASSGLTCLQAGRPLGPAVQGFAGCLCTACICMAACRAVAGAGTEGKEGFFISVYGSSRENLMDRTAAVARLRQCNKECYA